MDRLSEAEDRSLDARCRLPASPASRTAVVKLRALPPTSQAQCMKYYAQYDLPHLVRCAFDAVCHCSSGSLSVSLLAGALFAQGVSADVRWGDYDMPVLCVAAQAGSERALKALLDCGANVALADKKGDTAALHAAGFGRAVCLRLLLDAGANIEAKNTGSLTPLGAAAHNGHAECCSLLLAAGCAPNSCNILGEVRILRRCCLALTPGAESSGCRRR